MNTESGQRQESFGSKLIGYGVRYLVPLAFTILLVKYMFDKVNFSDMLDTIRGGVNYSWILLAMGISVLSHIFRAMRWRLQLRALGIDPPLHALSCSIFGTYSLNLIFPRLGEVWRCTYIARRQKAQLTTVLGSMVADRLADTITVMLLTLFTFLIAQGALTSFLVKYPIGQDIIALSRSFEFWAVAAASVGVVGVAVYALRHTRMVRRIKTMIVEMWKGFAVITKMEGRRRFLALTLCIWGCYFLQLYVAFYAFDYTARLCSADNALGIVPCLVAFVLSSIGMAVPSNGGLGPWNIAVMFGLAIYGISTAEGTAFSMLVWSAQTVMLIILGVYTMFYISSKKKNKNN